MAVTSRGLGSLASGVKRRLRRRWDVVGATGRSRYVPFDPE
jgi:hypothetical protein